MDKPLPAPRRNDFRSYNPKLAGEGAPPLAGARHLTLGEKVAGAPRSQIGVQKNPGTVILEVALNFFDFKTTPRARRDFMKLRFLENLNPEN